jgi:hypothetical protein
MGKVWDALEIPWFALEGTGSLFTKVLEFWPSVLFLFVFGWGFMALRWIAMNIPFLLILWYESIKIFFDIFATVYDVVARVVNIFGGNLKLLKPWPSQDKFFGGNFIDEVNDAGTTCQNFSNWESVFSFYAGQATGGSLCPFLRYISPVPWLTDVFEPLLGWLTLNPDPEGENCKSNGDDWLCAILGTGFLVLELLVPILIVCLVFTSYKRLLLEIVYIAFDAVEFILRVVFIKLIRGAYRDFEHFRCHASDFFTKRAHWRRRRWGRSAVPKAS